MALARYKQKRDFTQTPEPPGKTRPRARDKLSFVIQKHDASRLHYDFRLEMEGVLKSWAVPKGVPLEKGEKRLAMEVEDHPLEYGDFEGVIPEGNYGAGTVMLWDRGVYDVPEQHPLRALQAGKLTVVLHGKKLRGEWHLVRMRGRDEGDRRAWLLIKADASHQPIALTRADRSVSTRRTMEEIAADKSRVWQSHRPAAKEKNVARSARAAPRKATAAVAHPRVARKAPHPAFQESTAAHAAFVAPMKAVLVEEAPLGSHWLFEIKWDGYRAIAVKRRKRRPRW